MTTISIRFVSSPPVFSSGQNIKGDVILKLEHSVKAKCVRVLLEGKASTEWEVTEKSTDSHSRSSLVPYSALLDLVKEETIVWSGSEKKKALSEGDHSFPFSFTLPNQCPPSFEGKMGSIRYLLTVIIERPWKTNKTFTEYFSVCSSSDLNIIPNASDPQIVTKTKSIGLVFFRYGKVSLQCRLPQTGYVSGEYLHLDVEIVNDSSRQIVFLEISLIEVADYVAYRYGSESTRWHGTLDGENSLHQNNRKTEERRVMKMERELHIEPRSSLAISQSIPIPPCIPSFQNCPIIHTKHTVEVKIVAKGTINTSARIHQPVIIGTIPLANCKSGRLSAIVTHKEEDIHGDLEPSYQPCQYVNGVNFEKLTPLVPYHSYMLTEKDTPRM